MASRPDKTLSVTEAAERLGVSRTYILKLIASGKISAHKVGKTFVISEKALPGIYRPMTPKEKMSVERAVDRTLKEYGDVIKKLGET